MHYSRKASINIIFISCTSTWSFSKSCNGTNELICENCIHHERIKEISFIVQIAVFSNFWRDFCGGYYEIVLYLGFFNIWVLSLYAVQSNFEISYVFLNTIPNIFYFDYLWKILFYITINSFWHYYCYNERAFVSIGFWLVRVDFLFGQKFATCATSLHLKGCNFLENQTSKSNHYFSFFFVFPSINTKRVE